MIEMVTLKTEEVTPYAHNPRKNDGAVRAVQESIRQCGYVNPIVIDEENVILAGHTRYKALKAQKVAEIECMRVTGLTEEEKKKYRFLDNKTGEKAVWDILKLAEELEGVDLEGFDFFGKTADIIEEDETGAGQKHEASGSIEYGVGSFGDDKFKYQCPKCGFRF